MDEIVSHFKLHLSLPAAPTEVIFARFGSVTIR
jgi:hypothetical protein